MPFYFTRYTLLITLIVLLPLCALLVLGVYWLWQHNWLYQALAGLLASYGLVFLTFYLLKNKAQPLLLETMVCEANPNWSSPAQKAWQSVHLIAERYHSDNKLLTDPKKILQISNEVLTQVASQFHTDAKFPILEFPLPYLLKLIILVCNDIQTEVLDKIPGSHALKVGDFLRAKQAFDTFVTFKSVMNIGNWLFSWSGAAFVKAQRLLTSQGVNSVSNEISKRLLNIYITKLGYYAIELYSGHIALEDIVPTSILSTESVQDINQYKVNEEQTEPLRLLVLGQVSSGKSSLVNALFGEIKSAQGVLPTTSSITPYVLEKEGLQRAIILDSAGYDGLLQKHDQEVLKQQWDKVDIILMVCNVAQAARKEDAEQLNIIRHYFQEYRAGRNLPVIIAVATHIDRLRPLREWLPPYNIQQPETHKAQSIHDACMALAQDLTLTPECIVPVCLATDKKPYNIDEGLLPLIHERLNDAQRVRYLRCLREQKSEEYWQQWRKQVGQLGQIILRLGK